MRRRPFRTALLAVIACGGASVVLAACQSGGQVYVGGDAGVHERLR